jgi:putative transposase
VTFIHCLGQRIGNPGTHPNHCCFLDAELHGDCVGRLEPNAQGVIRGKPVRTTISDKATPCPLDHVNRQFKAARPNALWLSDFTYVATWAGLVYVAFVIDAYARRIVGWRVSRTAHAGFVLDALEQALHDRRPLHRGGLVHHSDSQWM